MTSHRREGGTGRGVQAGVQRRRSHLGHDLAAAPGHRFHLGIQVLFQYPYTLGAVRQGLGGRVLVQFTHRLVQFIQVFEQHAALQDWLILAGRLGAGRDGSVTAFTGRRRGPDLMAL